MTPTEDFELGRERLEELRARPGPGAIDREILAAVRERARPVHALVFRGRSGSERGFWRLSEQLDDDERVELATRIVRGQIETHRRLIAAGVQVLVHTELRVRELAALRSGSETVARELEQALHGAPTDQVPILRADLDILTQRVTYVGMRFDQAMMTRLPELLVALERQDLQRRRMFADLPRVALD